MSFFTFLNDKGPFESLPTESCFLYKPKLSRDTDKKQIAIARDHHVWLEDSSLQALQFAKSSV